MKKTCLFIIILLINTLGHAQQVIVGNITDSSTHKPLSGVTIKIENKYVSAQSDANGNYSIEVPKGIEKLIFEKKGYLAKEASIGTNILNVKLIHTLEEFFDLTIEELLNIRVITSSKKQESLNETPAYAIVLTANEIDALNFNTLEEVVNYITGLSTVTINCNTYTTTTSRGNSIPEYDVNNLLLFDGIPLYNMYHGSFDYSSIPLSSIKQIEVVKGSNSVLYGTNAMITVINIIPKNNDGKKNKFSGRIKYGSYNTTAAQAATTGKKDDLEYGIFSDFNLSEGEEMKVFDRNTGNKFNFQRGKKAGVVAGYVKYKNFKFNIQTMNRRYKNLYNSIQDTCLYHKGNKTFLIPYMSNTDIFQNMFTLSYNRNLGEKFRIHLRGSYQNYFQYRTFNIRNRTFNSYGYFNEVELTWTPNNMLSAMFGIQYNRYNAKRYSTIIRNGVKTKIDEINKDHIPTDDYAIYVNGDCILTKKLKVFYGARYYTERFGDLINNNFSPRFALTYQLTDNLNLKAIYGHSFRAPVYFEKSIDADIVSCDNLAPETSISYDWVLSGQFSKFQFNVDIFYNTIQDKILRIELTDAEQEKYKRESGEPRWRIIKNAAEAIFYGAELSGKFYLTERFGGFFGYAYAHAENPNNDPSSIADDMWYYKHLFNTGLSFKPLSYIELTTSTRIISKWGPAPKSTLINCGINIYPKPSHPFCIEFKADNILNEGVYMPELGVRDLEKVPYTPLTQNRRFYVGLSFRF